MNTALTTAATAASLGAAHDAHAGAAPRTLTQRLAASSLAALMTLAMLGTVDLLATSQPTPAQMARTAADAARG